MTVRACQPRNLAGLASAPVGPTMGHMLSHRVVNALHTVLYLAAMTGLLSLVGLLLAGWTGVFLAAAAVIGLALSGRGAPTWFALRLHGARLLAPWHAPELHSTVAALAERAELPALPTLYCLPTGLMTAFTTGDRERPALCVSEGLLRGLGSRELIGVLAHEVAHVQHGDAAVMAVASTISRVTGFLSRMGQLLLFINLPLLMVGATTVSWGAIGLLIAAPTISDLLQLALSRRREFEADLGGARLTGDPRALASALSKIERQQRARLRHVLLPGNRGASPSLLNTHPATGERIRRLSELAECPTWQACRLR